MGKATAENSAELFSASVEVEVLPMETQWFQK